MAASSHPTRVAVVGADGTMGRQIVALLRAAPEGYDVLTLDDVGIEAVGTEADEGPSLGGSSVVVHLDRWPCPTPDDDCAVAGLRLVEAASAAGVEHVVVLSSAVVYGAWPDNPVPLTEDAALRPNPGSDYALGKAEAERRWGEWADAANESTLTILRPAQVVGDDEQWLTIALRAATRWGVGDREAPAQFVHVDDLASAVVVAVQRRLNGIYNVAPEGWLEGHDVQDLAGTPLRPPVPPMVAAALARWCWTRGLGGVAPEWLPYATHSWVVAGGRLRGVGWAPAHTCAQTLLDSFPVTTWSRLDSRHRRELTLGATVLGAWGLPLALALLVRRRRARSPSSVGFVRR